MITVPDEQYRKAIELAQADAVYEQFKKDVMATCAYCRNVPLFNSISCFTRNLVGTHVHYWNNKTSGNDFHVCQADVIRLASPDLSERLNAEMKR